MDISGQLRLVRKATTRLLTDARALDDEALAAPSALPGWSRADLLGHLTADAATRAGDQEPAQDAAVDSPVAGLAAASEHLGEVWAVRSPEAWGRRLDHMRRGPSRVTSEVAARLVEVAVHHVDLDVGFSPDGWEPDVVDTALAHVMTSLGQRHARVSGTPAVWHLARTDQPGESEPSGWMVERAPYGTELHPGSGEADATVAGSGASLLAWLLGRQDLATGGLTVGGDADLAGVFPETYPY